MNAERDPKTNPQPGDIVRATQFKNERERHVFGAINNTILYYAVSPTNRRTQQCWISTWREWCSRKGVVVIQRGQQ